MLKNRVINWSIAKKWIKPFLLQKEKKILSLDGQWARFKISEDGMYTIPASVILNSGLELSNRDPRYFKLYTNSSLGRDRSSSISENINYEPISENLIEIGIYFLGESDGKIDSEDQIIFYGRGVNGINSNGLSINHHTNLYFNENNYWLFIPNNNLILGKRINDLEPSTNSVVSLEYGLSTFYEENDLINPFSGGLSWAGAAIPNNSSSTIVTSINSPNSSLDVTASIGLLGNSSSIETQGSPNHIIDIYHQSMDDLQATKSWVGLVKTNLTFLLLHLGQNLVSSLIAAVILDFPLPSVFSYPIFLEPLFFMSCILLQLIHMRNGLLPPFLEKYTSVSFPHFSQSLFSLSASFSTMFIFLVFSVSKF